MMETTHKPLVSAILYAHNRDRRVGHAIESVLNQNYENLELIVLDDDSTDETPEIIETFGKRDRRVRCIRQTPYGGPGKARNIANAEARGQYVAYIDGDDLWRPEKISLQLARFEVVSPKVGLITGAARFWNAESTRDAHVWRPKFRGDVYWDSFGARGEEYFGPRSTAMIRKDVLDEIGAFRENMSHGWRTQFYHRLAKEYEIDFVEDIVLDHYLDKEAEGKLIAGERIEQCRVSRRVMIESIREDLDIFPKIYALELRRLGHSYCLQGQWDEGRDCYREADRVAGRSRASSTLLWASWPQIASLYKIVHWFVNRPPKQEADTEDEEGATGKVLPHQAP